MTVDRQGFGDQQPAPDAPVVLPGEGVMATAGSGMVTSRATKGDQSGLMAAPCAAPATEHWFVGVGANPSYRTDLVLTNPDAGQAEVDLRFYGRNGSSWCRAVPVLVDRGRQQPYGLAGHPGHRRGTAHRLGARQHRAGLRGGPRPAQRRLRAHRCGLADLGRRPGPLGRHPGCARGCRHPDPGGRQPRHRPGARSSVHVLGVDGAFAPAGAETARGAAGEHRGDLGGRRTGRRRCGRSS